jgi:hypothetical protein
MPPQYLGHMNLAAETYIVRHGDNLSGIAQQRGYRDWSVIYNSRCNDALRRQRPNPNLIQPGDRVMLPPRPDQIRLALQSRLANLQRLEMESTAMFDGLVRELDGHFKAAEQKGQMVDVAADVINILKSLTSMTIKGFQGLSKSGAELAQINKELAKEAIDMPKDFLGEKVAMQTYANMVSGPQADAMREHTWWAMGGVAVQAWLDINSPSYWASTWVNWKSGMPLSQAVSTKPAEIHAAAVARMKKVRDDSLANVQKRIAQTQAELARFGPVIATPLPLK